MIFLISYVSWVPVNIITDSSYFLQKLGIQIFV
jgi:hypothetical protein